MGYPTKLLNQGEELALDLQPHWWFFWKHIVAGVALFAFAIFAFSNHADWLNTGSRYLFAILAIVWAVWVAIKYFDWRFTHFVVTNQRVVFRTGVLAKHGVEIPLERINNINFHQRMFERAIGAGDLDIESAGKDGQSHFDNVRRPDEVQQEIYHQMEANARRQASWGAAPAPAAAPVAPAASVPEQITQLAALRDAGHISAQEYEAKKSELLKRM